MPQPAATYAAAQGVEAHLGCAAEVPVATPVGVRHTRAYPSSEDSTVFSSKQATPRASASALAVTLLLLPSCSCSSCRSATRPLCWALWVRPSPWPPTLLREAPARTLPPSSAWPLLSQLCCTPCWTSWQTMWLTTCATRCAALLLKSFPALFWWDCWWDRRVCGGAQADCRRVVPLRWGLGQWFHGQCV